MKSSVPEWQDVRITRTAQKNPTAENQTRQIKREINSTLISL